MSRSEVRFILNKGGYHLEIVKKSDSHELRNSGKEVTNNMDYEEDIHSSQSYLIQENVVRTQSYPIMSVVYFYTDEE